MRRPILLALLSLCLGRENESEIVGDLEENVAERAEREGWLASRLWLLRQVLSLPMWLTVERLELLGTPSAASSHDKGSQRMRSRKEDARFAVRSFLRSPGFSLITVITLALGVAANTAIFSVVDGVLLEALPYPESERLVYLSHTAPGVGLDRIGTANGIHLVYDASTTELETLATYVPTSVNVTGDGDPIRVDAVLTTPSMFDVLRVRPLIGREFTPEEGRPDAPTVTVISYGFWSSRFGRDPSVLGKSMLINDRSFEIVGVMPEGFSYPRPGVQIVLPLVIDPGIPDFGGFNTQSVARLAAGATVDDAERELNQLLPRVADRFADMTPEMLSNTQLGALVQPLKEVIVGPVKTALWILMGTVGFVMLIACANIGNLFLARAESRQKEVAIRTAMGAGRRDLFWQYAMESGILAIVGGAMGTALAFLGLRVLTGTAPPNLPRIADIGVDGSVLLFTAGLSVVAAFLFGTVPMLRHSIASPGSVLRDGSRGSTSGRTRGRARQVLVATQVAFALVLLAGSGLMLRSFRQLLNVELGFRPTEVLTFRIALPQQGYATPEAVARFHQLSLDRIEAIPGVARAGAVSQLPLVSDWNGDPLNREEEPLGPNEIPAIIEFKGVSPGYFTTMEIPLLRGRFLDRGDTDDRAPVVLINQTLAQQYWPGEDPIGRRIKHGLPDTGDWSTIVGVVGDTPARSLTEPPKGLVYYSLAPMALSNVSWLTRTMTYAVRSPIPPEQLTVQVRQALAEQDPNLPMAEVQMLDRHVESARTQMAFTMLLLSIAAAMGLLLGAIGIYGVMSYLTGMRTREIGVRMALGAEASRVQSMVLRQGATVSLLGVALGLLGAFGLTRFLKALLYGVSATDPLTLVAATTLLFGVSMLATYIPARRAAGTAPQEALRED